MQRLEWTARILIVLIVFGLPLGALGYQYGLRPALSQTRVIDIQANAPEVGGFQPGHLRLAAGETVTLRFHSTDVTHGIAIGPGLGIDLGHVDPGHIGEVTLSFDHPGTYTYYCNTWCSPDHWRMRGVIEVYDPANPNQFAPPQPDPIIEQLVAEGVNIDASLAGSMQMDGMEMPAAPTVEITSVSVEAGAILAETLTLHAELTDPEWRRSHTPSEAIEHLRHANPTATDAELADAVAFLWLPDAPDAFTTRLYEQNCAACHGENGAGDGPAAPTTAELPVAFTDLTRMFTMRADVLYAKIRRGGMGTDMPNFGTLLTQDETWALVDYLWWLALRGEP